MRLRASVLALALLGAMATVAQADPLFDAYHSLCVKTGADAAASLAAADASGWMPIPQALLAPLSGSAGIEDAQGRMKSDAAGINIIMVGHKHMPLAGETSDTRFCAVATTGSVGPGLKDALATWAAVAPLPALSAEGRIGYAFTDNGGVHAILTKPEEAQTKPLLRSGRVRLAFIQEGKGVNLLAFAVPTL